MTILVDMDETISGLLDAWTGCLKGRYGIGVCRDDIKDWDMQKAYPELSKEQIYAPLLEESLWESVEPLPGAAHYIKKLMDEGHDIVIVTASHYDSIRMKMRNVLLRHFPFVPYENVIITSRKQMVMGDVLVDDYPGNLIGGSYRGILFDAPHNRKFEEEKYGIIRAKSWDDVYSILKSIEKEIQDDCN